jgi:uncharacterized delta-60 repeat protein
VDFSGFDDLANTHVLQPDGKLVMGGWADVYPGDFGAVRYMPNGSLDATFGNGGRVTTAFADDPELVDAAYASNARPNGGFHLFGETCDADYIVCDLAAAAYLADGSLDTSFGGDGRVTTSVGTEYGALSWPRRNILQSDGKLVAAGVIYQDDGDVDIVLVRYNPDGSPDNTFSDDGVAVLDFEGANNYPQDIIATPDGKIMIAGAFGTLLPNSVNYFPENALLARVNADGSLDDTFGGGDGYFTWQYNGGPTSAQYMVITPAAELMLLGWVPGASDGGDCTLQRYDLEGNLDQTFGTNGWVMIDSGQDDYCWQMEMTPDGGLAFAGNRYPPTPPDSRAADGSVRGIGRGMVNVAHGAGGGNATLAPVEETFENFVIRYQSDGTPDAAFGDGGLVGINFGDDGGWIDGLSVLPNGKIVTRGNALNGDSADFAALRLLDDLPALANPGAFDPTYGVEGTTRYAISDSDYGATAAVIQSDNKLVMTSWVNGYPGDFGLARLLPNGRLDPSFGDGGKVITRFSDDPDLPNAPWSIVQRSDGTLIAAGEICDADYVICQYATAAYLPDGTLDDSFGDEGLVLSTVPGAETVYAWGARGIAQSDDKVIFSGVVFAPGGDADIVLRRHNTDGSLDDTFGTGGLAVFDFEDTGNYPQRMRALPGDKIVVTGGYGEAVDAFTYNGEGSFLALFNSDGSPDENFGTSGYVTWDQEDTTIAAEDLAVATDGTIYVTGYVFPEGGLASCVVWAFDSSGNVDMDFGEDGSTFISRDGSDVACRSIELLPNNKLGLGGGVYPPVEQARSILANGSRGLVHTQRAERSADEGETADGLVGRLNADGSLDTTFANGGIQIYDFGMAFNVNYFVHAQTDGRLLAIGDLVNPESELLETTVSRFLGDGPAAQVFAPVIRR